MTSETTSELRDRIIEAMRTVKDPEIPINLYDLGLIYELEIDEAGAVSVEMTLTTPNCPVADMLPTQVKRAVEAVEGVASAQVNLTWEPPWTPSMVHEDAKAVLEMMGIDVANPHRRDPFTSLSVGRSAKKRGER